MPRQQTLRCGAAAIDIMSHRQDGAGARQFNDIDAECRLYYLTLDCRCDAFSASLSALCGCRSGCARYAADVAAMQADSEEKAISHYFRRALD